jgi:MFS transporter, AAHS family, 4-hydroxybenzoate transporter
LISSAAHVIAAFSQRAHPAAQGRETVPTNVSDVIDNARFNAFHLWVAFLCGLMVFLDGYDLTAVSYAAPQFIHLFGITRAMIAPVFSAGLFGLTIGALAFGLVADRLGAKWTFILCGIGFGVFSIAAAFAPSVGVLVVVRFFAGLMLGGATPISIAIASDFVPRHVRTSVTMIMYISIALGAVVAGYSYGFLSIFGWRTVFYVGGALPIVLAPLFLVSLPETLVFQVMHNAPVDRIRATLTRIDPTRDVSRETRFTVARENKPGFQPAQLFEDRRAPITIMLWVTFFGAGIALFFFNSWLPTLLSGRGLSGKEVVVISASLQFGGIIGTLLVAPIVVRMPPFLTTALLYLLAAIAMVVLGRGGSEFGFLICAVLAVGIFLIGAQSVLNASCANVYPPSMRGTGVGWGFGVGRGGSVLSPAIAGLLLAMHWTPSQLFLVAAVPTLVAATGALGVQRLLRRRAETRAASGETAAA